VQAGVSGACTVYLPVQLSSSPIFLLFVQSSVAELADAVSDRKQYVKTKFVSHLLHPKTLTQSLLDRLHLLLVGRNFPSGGTVARMPAKTRLVNNEGKFLFCFSGRRMGKDVRSYSIYRLYMTRADCNPSLINAELCRS